MRDPPGPEEEQILVWPSKVRRRQRKHAFELALDEAELGPDGEPLIFDDVDGPNPGAARAIGSLGEIPVAAGYVGRSSLQRAYDDEDAESGAMPRETVRPQEAAAELIGKLSARPFAVKELAGLRRAFALQNHPDRVPDALRDEAVRAMADVNAAIDRALKAAAPE